MYCRSSSGANLAYLWTNQLDGTTVESDRIEVAPGSLTCTVTNNITSADGTTQTCSDHANIRLIDRLHVAYDKIIFT